MNKATVNALERIWIREISGTLPLQSSAKVFERLKDKGLVQRMTLAAHVGHFGAMEIHGWELTHAGRLAYCMTCSEFQTTAEHEP